MTRDDIQKLLGGYATGTLTAEEQRALFEAALTDQELFDALAREEALRDALSDPAARAHLLAALDDVPAPWYRAWWRPMVVMAAALLAVAGVAVWEHARGPKRLPDVATVERPRFQPPTTTQNAAPVLPPPPEVKTARPAMKALPLPPEATPAAPPPAASIGALAAPAPPPPPPAPRAAAQSGVPMQQNRQAQVAPSQAEAGDRFAPVRPPSPAPAAQGGLQSGVPMRQKVQTPTISQAEARDRNAPVGPPAPAPQSGVPAQLQAPTPAASPVNGRDRTTLAILAPVAVHGTVTDTSGAGIASANVVLRSLTTGDTFTASTDERGQFEASAPPGSTYQITAAKPGFQTATVHEVAPANGPSAPVNLRMQLAAATTTAEVSASAVQLDARAGMGAMMKKSQVESVPASAYQLLRMVRGGSPIEVPAEGSVPARSTLTLRVTPAADGELRIDDGTRTLATRKVRSGVAAEIKLPRFDRAGRVELHVRLSATQVTIPFNVQ
jgi:hypothetical protein